MAQAIVAFMLFFAALGFAGAGIAFAFCRARELAEADTDVGTRSVSVLLLILSASCTYVAAGLTAIFAFGGVIAWSSYVLAAQRAGVFRIEPLQPRSSSVTERRHIA